MPLTLTLLHPQTRLKPRFSAAARGCGKGVAMAARHDTSLQARRPRPAGPDAGDRSCPSPWAPLGVGGLMGRSLSTRRAK